MPSKNPRVNMTFEPGLLAQLARLAKRESKSVAGLAKDLVIEALELREDRALSTLATTRDTDKARYRTHDEAWGD